MLGVFLIWFQTLVYAASPEGLWLSKDEKTGKARAVIQVEKINGTLQAKVTQVFKQPGDTGICEKCPEPFTNKPVLNMVFAWGLMPTKEGHWDKGRILDPKSGKVYRGKMILQSDNALLVRGYLGISLLGRSQIWERYQK